MTRLQRGRWSALGSLAILLSAGQGRAIAATGMVDLTRAVVVAPEKASGPEAKAVRMLVEEVEKRSGVRFEVKSAWTGIEGRPVIAVARQGQLAGLDDRLKGLDAAKGAEGFRIKVDASAPGVLVVGNDTRGVLFGVGRLLRELRMTRGKVAVPADFALSTAPKMAIRGHQLGYRPKTNSYDGWDIDQWEQYYRELIVFGLNAVELIPPRSDDEADSPHFPRPPLDMMIKMSQLAKDYGLDLWIWYPAMDPDYENPATVDRAIKEWADVLKHLPKVDHIFVPGGDPGHTQPKYLMPMLEKQAASIKKLHPNAKMWMSPQGFTKPWMDEYLEIMKAEPEWLEGVVFGPQVRMPLDQLRKALPKRYPIRNYPDITHTLKCQYPVPEWDVAYAVTQDREIANPRPVDQTAIFRSALPDTVGYITYSEGCHDDVNKVIWSALGWDPETPAITILREYARYYMGEEAVEGVAQGLMALERNWRGPLLTNKEVDTTYRQFRDIEKAAGPGLRRNWRFQLALYRADFDSFVRDRLINETALEAEARDALKLAPTVGAIPAMAKAEAILNRSVTSPVAVDKRARMLEVAEALFQSIHLQLSVSKYQAVALGRGTSLDTMDLPLNDRLWLTDQFEAVRKLGKEEERLAAIDALLNRADPGPGGFYDDLGDLTNQPHLQTPPGSVYASDPDFRRSPYLSYTIRPRWPMAWRQAIQALHEAPIVLKYEDLDPKAAYKVKVVYAGDNMPIRVRLDAEGTEVHGLMPKPEPPVPFEFPIPAAATADGKLTLTWTAESGRGGNGRGNQVAEVWLIKK